MYKRFMIGALLSTLISVSPLVVGQTVWTEKTTIRLIYTSTEGKVTMKIMSSTPDIGCAGGPSGGWISLQPNSPNFSATFSLLAAAMTANRTIQVGLQGCDEGFPSATQIQFFND